MVTRNSNFWRLETSEKVFESTPVEWKEGALKGFEVVEICFTRSERPACACECVCLFGCVRACVRACACGVCLSLCEERKLSREFVSRFLQILRKERKPLNKIRLRKNVVKKFALFFFLFEAFKKAQDLVFKPIQSF